MNKLTKEIKIAIVAVLGILIIYAGMNFLKGKALLTNERSYFVKFSDVTGLAVSNPVLADGYKVGVVKDIHYDYRRQGEVLVELSLNKELRIPFGTTAEIESDFMGNVKMNLLMANNPRQRVEPGDTIEGHQLQGALAKVGAMVPKIEQMLPKIDSLLMALNAIASNPDIARSLDNLQVVTSNLKTTTGEVNRLMAGLNGKVPGMLAKADKTLSNTQVFTANLAALDLQGTMTRVNQTLANVQQATEKLNSKDGSLGLLLNDPTLYNNLNKTMVSADSLLTNFKAHPKRYVHFSLFGRKDK